MSYSPSHKLPPIASNAQPQAMVDGEAQLDPRGSPQRSSHVTVAFLEQKHEVAHISIEGHLPADDFATAVTVATEACQQVD